MPFALDQNETFPQLANAPIIEAVIAWNARAKELLKPDELKVQLAQLVEGYPTIEPLRAQRIQAMIGPDGSSHSTSESWLGYRLVSADKCHVAQFTRNGVVLSRLPPYADWEEFTEAGRRVWRAYLELAQPEQVDRLGVRFINRLGPVDRSDLGRYLVNPPIALEPLGLPMEDFTYQSLHGVPNCPLQVNIVQTIQPPASSQGEGHSLILDIDVFTTQGFRAADEGLQNERLFQMRWLKDKAFFSMVTPQGLERYA